MVTSAPPVPSPARHPIRRLIQRWGPKHARTFVIANLLVIVIAGATAGYPLLIDYLVDALQARERLVLVTVPVAVLLLTLAKGAALYAQTVLVSRIAQRMIADIRADLYMAILRFDLGVLAGDRAVSLQARVLHDTNLLNASLTQMAGRVPRDALTCAALLGSVIYLDWVLSLIVIAVYGINVRPVLSIGRRTRSTTTDVQAHYGALSSFLAETFQGMRTVRAFNLGTARSQQGKSLIERLYALQYAIERRRAQLSPLLEFGGGVVVALIIVVAGWRILEGSSTIGAFSGFVSAVLLALRPARALADFSVTFQQAASAAERVFEKLEQPPGLVDRPDARDCPRPEGEIRFENVGFRYTEGGSVLRDVNLVIRPGERVALVGPSGAGKTTLINLVLRMFDPSEGRILLDRADIREFTLESLRSHFGLVAQEATLFHGSLRDNVEMGRPGAGDAAIREALLAAAADFVDTLPDGLDTVVGDQGDRLSGGERQRVALARAILRDPAVLILDEPTSALDAESEHRIQEALGRLTAGRTTITIAHRLSTVVRADRILLMEGGTIVDQGTHAALMAQSAPYRRLVELQAVRSEDRSIGTA
ncbi:MAG: ABC transporter ATP-binding protein [Rhodospirillales bacterium]|nr:ABC transporter ATP-binding protein [Rhodospirillales bacterium]